MVERLVTALGTAQAIRVWDLWAHFGPPDQTRPWLCPTVAFAAPRVSDVSRPEEQTMHSPVMAAPGASARGRIRHHHVNLQLFGWRLDGIT